MSELSSEEHTDGEEYTGSESGSTEEGSGSENGSYEEGSEEESEEGASDHEEEPVLKYRRFAKEVVNSISGASEEERNIICCISVHPKVSYQCARVGLRRFAAHYLESMHAV